MPNTKTETYYTACVQLKENKDSPFATDNRVGWLGVEPQWGYKQVFSFPYSFTEPPTLQNYMKWNGMPWYCQIKEGTLQVFKHTVTTITEVEEVQL